MKKYITQTLNGMAYGLFATLIIGVIFQQVGNLIPGLEFLSNELYPLLSRLMGLGIGLGIGLVLGKQGLFLIMTAIIGALSTSFTLQIDPLIINPITAGPGNPLTAYFVTVFSIVLIDAILRKKTPVDIIIVPLVSIIVGLGLTLLLSMPLDLLNKGLRSAIFNATEFAPFLMVIVISISMGMILTAPISSAAIAIVVLGSNPIAAGAAVVGTSIQMIGFAIQSRRDNDIGTVVSIGIGTSMLQFENIVKKPIIWLPTIIASGVIAPITWALGFTSNEIGAGMGTSGLVGVLQSLEYMGYSNWQAYLNLAIIIVAGGLLVYFIDLFMYKKGWIVDGDLAVNKQLEK